MHFYRNAYLLVLLCLLAGLYVLPTLIGFLQCLQLFYIGRVPISHNHFMGKISIESPRRGVYTRHSNCTFPDLQSVELFRCERLRERVE